MFEKIIVENIKKNSRVIAGISGGPDSVYLLLKCLELQKKHPFTIIVAHVNHNLRPKQSKKDALFVKKLAKKYKLIYEELSANVKKMHGNLEEEGRKARYDFFEKLRKKHKAEWILTAHHLNDNIETALFNLIRGGSYQGIKGMQLTSPKKHLLRPMLTLPRTEILQYLKRHAIVYCLDKSNEDTKFSRNFLRIKIIPLLKKINSNFEQTFAQNLENFNQIAAFLEKKSQNWLKKEEKIPLELFLKEPLIMQKNILACLYKNIYGNTKKLTHHQIEEILKVLHQKKANRKKEFGEKYFLKIVREGKFHEVKLEKKVN
jgi:tRNA(Ile)-lysidine synthase